MVRIFTNNSTCIHMQQPCCQCGQIKGALAELEMLDQDGFYDTYICEECLIEILEKFKIHKDMNEAILDD